MEMEKEPILAVKRVVNLKEIGVLLKTARKKEKLTQKALAKELGVDVMTISLAENGSDRTGKVLLNRLALRLGVTFDLTFPYEENNQQ